MLRLYLEAVILGRNIGNHKPTIHVSLQVGDFYLPARKIDGKGCLRRFFLGVEQGASEYNQKNGVDEGLEGLHNSHIILLSGSSRLNEVRSERIKTPFDYLEQVDAGTRIKESLDSETEIVAFAENISLIRN